MDAGLSSNNTRWFINISQLANQIDKEVVAALSGLHAYTVSDYTTSFIGKGQIGYLIL